MQHENAEGHPGSGLPHFIGRHVIALATAWILLAVGLNILAPFWRVDLSTDAALPSAPSDSAALSRIDRAFPGTGTSNVIYVVFKNVRPLDANAHAHIRSLVERLRGDTAAVNSVIDMSADPLTAPIGQNADLRNAYIQAWLAGPLGSERGRKSVATVQSTIDQVPTIDGLHVDLTGPAAAAYADFQSAHHLLPWMITAVVIAMTLLVLASTDSLAESGTVLLTAFIALSVALPLQRLAGPHWSGSPQVTSVPLTVSLTIGAALSYTRMLLNAYRCRLPRNPDHRRAIGEAYRCAAPIACGSAAIVSITLIAATIADLPELRGIGIATGIGVGVSLLLVLTLAPAWTSRLGQQKARRWLLLAARRRATYRLLGRAFRRPGATLAGTVVVVIGLGLGMLTMNVGFGDPAVPANTQAQTEYRSTTSYFDANRMYSQTVLIEADHDLRRPAGLLAIDRVTRRLMEIPNVQLVQSATWPAGLPWADATLAHQLGELNRQLQSDGISALPLIGSIRQLPRTLDQLTSSIDLLEQRLNTGVAALSSAGTSLSDVVSSLREIDTTVTMMSSYADPIREWMARFPDCSSDSLCSTARKVVAPLDDVLDHASAIVQSSRGLSASVSAAPQTLIAARVSLSDVRRTLTDIRPLVEAMADTVGKVSAQMTRTTAFISMLTADLSASGDGGFYMPQSAIDAPSYRGVKSLLFSADGHATRLFVYSAGNLFGDKGIHLGDAVIPAVHDSTKFGALTHSAVSTVGVASATSELQARWRNDFRNLMFIGAAVIFATGALALRSVVAGMTIAVGTVVCFVSGLGLFVLLWRAQLDFTTLLMSFVVFAAVAAQDGYRLYGRFTASVQASQRSWGGDPALLAAALVFSAAVLGASAITTATLNQTGAIVGTCLLLSYVAFRIGLTTAISFGRRHRAARAR